MSDASRRDVRGARGIGGDAGSGRGGELLKGANIGVSPQAAARRYSWMRSPSRSRRRIVPEPDRSSSAQSLGGDDEVALEATGNALGIARIIAPHVGRVVLTNPKAVKGITQAGAKTDRIARARWRSCSPAAFCARSGYRTSRRGSCAAASRRERSVSGSAPAPRTRCTRRSSVTCSPPVLTVQAACFCSSC